MHTTDYFLTMVKIISLFDRVIHPGEERSGPFTFVLAYSPAPIQIFACSSCESFFVGFYSIEPFQSLDVERCSVCSERVMSSWMTNFEAGHPSLGV